MGKSLNAAQLGRKFDRLATTIDRGQTATAKAMGFTAKDQFNAAFTAATSVKAPGNSLNMGAYFNVKGRTALVGYRGPVHWWEGGTVGHMVTPRGLGKTSYKKKQGKVTVGKGKKGGARALKTPEGPRRRAYVKGMKPKPFFKQAKQRTEVAALAVHKQELHRNILRAGFG